jgi:hypothetical protein
MPGGKKKGGASGLSAGSGSDSDEERKSRSNRSILSTLSSQLVYLDQSNFQPWKQSLVAVQYFARWDLEILDIEGTSVAPPLGRHRRDRSKDGERQAQRLFSDQNAY